MNKSKVFYRYIIYKQLFFVDYVLINTLMPDFLPRNSSLIPIIAYSIIKKL